MIVSSSISQIATLNLLSFPVCSGGGLFVVWSFIGFCITQTQPLLPLFALQINLPPFRESCERSPFLPLISSSPHFYLSFIAEADPPFPLLMASHSFLLFPLPEEKKEKKDMCGEMRVASCGNKPPPGFSRSL